MKKALIFNENFTDFISKLCGVFKKKGSSHPLYGRGLRRNVFSFFKIGLLEEVMHALLFFNFWLEFNLKGIKRKR